MKQAIISFVIGIILGGLIMWFVLQPKYELVHVEMEKAWVINKRTGEVYSLYYNDKHAKPPYE